MDTPTMHAGDGGRGRGPRRIDPKDRAQLADAPIPFSRIVELFRPHRRPLAVVTLIIAATSVVSMAQPFLVREVVDDALPSRTCGCSSVAVGGMVAVAVVTAVLGVVQTWLDDRRRPARHARAADRLFGHLQRQSVGFFTRTRGGEVQSRLTHDINGMQAVITSTATSIASNLTTAVATAVAMVALARGSRCSPWSSSRRPIWLTREVALLRRTITARQQRRLADLHAQVEEGLTVSGIRSPRPSAPPDADAASLRRDLEDLIDLELRSQLAGRWRMATMQIVFAAIPALIYLAAGLPRDLGRHDDRHAHRLHHAAGRHLPPAHGAAQRRRPVGQPRWPCSAGSSSYLDLPVDVARAGHPGRARPGRAAR